MSQGSVSFIFNGMTQNLRVELALVPRLEAACGLGVVGLARQLQDFSATSTVVCAVLREALAANGKHYSAEEIFGMVKDAGLLPAYKCAGLIVAKLFDQPEEATKPGKKQPAEKTGGTQTPTH